MPKYIQADQFFYPHGIRQGGYLELVGLENGPRKFQQIQM